MARLTRTQKYAELRDRLSNDREENYLTKELKKYESKLQGIEDAFAALTNEKVEVTQEPFTVSEPEVKEEVNKELDILDLLNTHETFEPEKVEPITLEEPVVEEVKEEENSEVEMNLKLHSIEDMLDDLVSEIELKVNQIAPTNTEKLAELSIDEVIDKQIEENKTILDEPEDVINYPENTDETVTFDIHEILNEFQKLEPIYEEPEEETKVIETVKEEVVEVKPEVKEETVYELNPPKYSSVFEAISKEVEQITSLMDPSMKPAPIVETSEEEKIEELPVEETEVVEEAVETEEIVEEVVEVEDIQVPTIEELIEEIMPQEVVAEPEVEAEPETTIELPTIEEIVGDVNLEEVFEINEPEQVEEEEVDPISQALSAIDAVENEIINNNFMSDVLDEVNKYNAEEGRETLDTLPGKIIDEVRKAEREASGDNEEDRLFSETVTLQLDKVLQEISANQEISSVNEEEIAIPSLEEVVVEEESEHPTLAIAQEEDAPVEIKNITETLRVDTNVLEDTIPFEIAKPQSSDLQDDEYYDDDESEMPSKLLNVILGVLIVVLVLVLGIIIYYILVARGILG